MINEKLFYRINKYTIYEDKFTGNQWVFDKCSIKIKSFYSIKELNDYCEKENINLKTKNDTYFLGHYFVTEYEYKELEKK